MTSFINHIELYLILAAPLTGLMIHLRGRWLLRAINDPSFEARLWQYRVRTSLSITGSTVCLGLAAWRWLPLTMPLLALSTWIGMYPLQRRLFGEQRPLGEYLIACVRLAAGTMLFWIAVFFEPMLVGTVGLNNWGWVLAALIFWLYLYQSQMLWALRAEPLTEPDLHARLQAIAAKAHTRPPAIYVIGSPNGSFVNALALPDARRPAVLLSRSLLRHLDADQTAAIFAHEVAHLEQYAMTRRRISRWAFFVILIIGAVLPALVESAFAAEILWVFAFAVGGMLRRAGRRRRETKCDLRAIELGADPHVLIRALTNVHRLGRIPTRWPRWYARRATHPSLEQRVADITSSILRTSPDIADSGLAHSSAS